MAATESQRNLDNKTNQIISGRAVRGNDYAALQSAQQQLMAIQAEQRQNLNMARQEAQNQAAQRNILSQAGSMAAMASMPQGNPLVVNPATRAVLGKYGVGQPKTISTRNQQVTKQNVIINNNNITNNNVTVPAGIGGPVAGRPVQINQQAAGVSGLDKFKNWMNAALAKQNEDAQKRDVEYRRREWSLTRSANKMVKKIEDYAKSFGDKMDPKRIGSTWTSQMKSLLMVFGFGALAKNWGQIITKIASIEEKVKEFFDYIGVGIKDPNKRSQLGNKIISLLGGDPDKEGTTVMSTLKTLFVGEDGEASDGSSIIGYIKGWIDNAIQDRKDSVNHVIEKGPGDMTLSLSGNLQKLATWLGDILGAAIGGSKTLENAAGNKIIADGNAASEKEAIENNRDLLSSGGVSGFNKVSSKLEDGTEVWANAGIQSWLDGDSVGRVHSGMYNTSSNEHIVGLGSEVHRLVGDAKNGNVKTDQMASALSELQKAAASGGQWVPLQRSLIDGLFTTKEIEGFKSAKILKDAWYKLVAVEKNMVQYEAERELLGQAWNSSLLGGAVQFMGNAGPNPLNYNKALGFSKSGLGDLMNGAIVTTANIGNRVLGGMEMLARNIVNSIGGENTVNKGSYTGTTDYIQEMRPAEPNEPGSYLMYAATYAMIKEIIKKISGKSNASSERSFIEGVNNNLTAMSVANGHSNPTNSFNPSEYYKETDAIANANNARQTELNRQAENGQVGEAGRNIKETTTNVANKVIDTAKNAIDGVSEWTNNIPRLVGKEEYFDTEPSTQTTPTTEPEKKSVVESIVDAGHKVEQKELEVISGGINKILERVGSSNGRNSITGKTGDVPWRNNNPGDLKGSIDWDGSIPNSESSFATFKDSTWGFKALMNQAESHISGNSSASRSKETKVHIDGTEITPGPRNTVKRMIYAWAPPEDKNDTKAYVKYVSDALGVKPDDPLPLPSSDKEFAVKLAKAIAHVEGSAADSYWEKENPGVFDKAWTLFHQQRTNESAYNANLSSYLANSAASGNANIKPTSVAVSSSSSDNTNTASGSNVYVEPTPIATTSASSSETSSSNSTIDSKLDVGNKIASADLQLSSALINEVRGLRTDVQGLKASGSRPEAQQSLTQS